MSRSKYALALGLVFVATTALAQTTRTLRVELTDVSREFVVENLAGKMTVVADDTDKVIAIATVHAEDEELAQLMRFEEVRGKLGVTTLRVQYPLGRYRKIRYPGGGSSDTKYDDHRVRVRDHGGVMLYADVEVRVPKSKLHATFRNYVGSLTADNVTGRILLDTASADITARNLSGDIKTDSGSGNVEANSIKGNFVCDTGSGDCTVTGINGDDVSFDTGSGEVRAREVMARRVKADTGSGGVRIEQADIEDFLGDTGSGNIRVEVIGARLRRLRADTGSGDVTILLPSDATFELETDTGSGDVDCDFSDAKSIVRHREVIGYTRGDGKISIFADTGSGNVSVRPNR